MKDFAADVVLRSEVLRVERAVLAGHSGSCVVASLIDLSGADRELHGATRIELVT